MIALHRLEACTGLKREKVVSFETLRVATDASASFSASPCLQCLAESA